jgi:hypothetical protein
MSQIIGSTPGVGGIQLGLGAGGVGQLVILTGPGDPNLSSDATVVPAANGSLYLRVDGSTSTTLYVKTALPNVWTAK